MLEIFFHFDFKNRILNHGPTQKENTQIKEGSRSRLYIQVRKYLMTLNKYPEGYFKYQFLRVEDQWEDDIFEAPTIIINTNDEQIFNDEENIPTN